MIDLPNRKDFPNVGLLRPYFDKDGMASVTFEESKHRFDPNATIVKRCVLTVPEWIEIEYASQRAIRYRMPFVGRLMSHKLFDEEPGWRDEMELPITHVDAWVSTKEISECHNLGEPLPYAMFEAASRRVAECLEQAALGVNADKFDCRCVGVFNDSSVVNVKCPKLDRHNVCQVAKLMLLKAVSEGLTGPFLFVHGMNLVPIMDDEFYHKADYSGFTNKEIIKHINSVDGKPVKILGVMSSPYLWDEFGLIQMTKDVAKVRIGQYPTVVQWADSEGEMRVSFKALAVMKTEFGGNGIVLADQEKQNE